MLTVALVGPDGAGKTTVARELQRTLEIPSVYLYMGVNFESGNRVLPTSRLIRWARRHQAPRLRESNALARPVVRSRRRGPLAGARSLLRLANRIGEETYREFLTYRYKRAGNIVIFDRHFFADFFATDVSGARRDRWSDRIHGLFLARFYPKPDLIVYLDAPVEVLFARKGEGTLESLAAQKRSYEQLGKVAPRFLKVDANRPLHVVVAEIAHVVSSIAKEFSNTKRKEYVDVPDPSAARS